MLKHASLVGLAVFALHSALGAAAHAQPGEEEEEPAMAPAPDPVPVEPEPEPEPEPEREAPAPVRVQPSGPGGEGPAAFDVTDPNAHAHSGFLGRAIFGFGYQQISFDEGGASSKISGLSTNLLFALGYSVRPRLAIHAELGFVGLADPTVEINGEEVGEASGTAVELGIGPGATYYLNSNAYVSGSLMFGSISFSDDDNDESDSTDTGVALSITGGKEWWIGPNLGVGVVGHLMFGSYPIGDDVDGNFTTASFTLNASATYN